MCPVDSFTYLLIALGALDNPTTHGLSLAGHLLRPCLEFFGRELYGRGLFAGLAGYHFVFLDRLLDAGRHLIRGLLLHGKF